jgi:hypothetical protein
VQSSASIQGSRKRKNLLMTIKLPVRSEQKSEGVDVTGATFLQGKELFESLSGHALV